jgi:hypothetical protein
MPPLRRGRLWPSGARPSYTWYAGRLGTGRGARARVQVRTNSKKQQIQRRQLDAGPTTSPCKPTASMHMSAASYCRAGALTRFICARHARTARAAGRRARALVRGGRNSSAWAQRRPRRRFFMAPQCSRRPCGDARPLPSSRACAWYRTGPPAHAHRGRPSDKQVGEAAVYVNRFLGQMHGETDRADCDAWDDPDHAEDSGPDV